MEELYGCAKKLDPKKDMKEYLGYQAVLSRNIATFVVVMFQMYCFAIKWCSDVFGRLLPSSVAVVDEQVGAAANFDGEETNNDNTSMHRGHHHDHADGQDGQDGQYAAFMDQFEHGRTVLKQHQKFGSDCTARIDATMSKLSAVLSAGREAIYGPLTEQERAVSALTPTDSAALHTSSKDSDDDTAASNGTQPTPTSSGQPSNGASKDSNRHLARSSLFIQVGGCGWCARSSEQR